MNYVFDTGAFIVLKHFYPTTFATLWSRIDALAANGTIVSVREVFNELHNYNDVDFIQDWAKQHKAVFAKPGNDELLVVQQILAIPHFQALVSNKAILKGTPVADPFVVAAGKSNTTGKAGGLILLAPQRRLQNREPLRGKPSADSTALPTLTSTPQLP